MGRSWIPDIVNDYRAFEEIRTESMLSGRLDLSGMRWVRPTMLLPLAMLMKHEKGLTYIPPTRPEVARYIDIVTSETDASNLRERTYIPTVRLPLDQRDAERILKVIYSLNGNDRECGRGECVQISCRGDGHEHL